MSPGHHPSAPEYRRRDQVVLEPGERRAAMLRAMVVTYDPAVARSLVHLFESDVSGLPPALERRFSRRRIIGPEQARTRVHTLIADARRSIRILDHKLSDPEVVALLRDRRHDGVAVSVIGSAHTGPLEWHGKLMIVDEARAVLGSMALSTLSLDFRREVAIVVDDAAAVRRLNVSYQQLQAHAGPLVNRLPGDKP